MSDENEPDVSKLQQDAEDNDTERPVMKRRTSYKSISHPNSPSLQRTKWNTEQDWTNTKSLTNSPAASRRGSGVGHHRTTHQHVNSGTPGQSDNSLSSGSDTHNKPIAKCYSHTNSPRNSPRASPALLRRALENHLNIHGDTRRSYSEHCIVHLHPQKPTYEQQRVSCERLYHGRTDSPTKHVHDGKDKHVHFPAVLNGNTADNSTVNREHQHKKHTIQNIVDHNKKTDIHTHESQSQNIPKISTTPPATDCVQSPRPNPVLLPLPSAIKAKSDSHLPGEITPITYEKCFNWLENVSHAKGNTLQVTMDSNQMWEETT